MTMLELIKGDERRSDQGHYSKDVDYACINPRYPDFSANTKFMQRVDTHFPANSVQNMVYPRSNIY